MSSDLSPVIPGQVVNPVNPTSVTQSAASGPAHEFFGVIKRLVNLAGFHNQSDVQNALSAVDAYEKHVVPPGDFRAIDTEGDPAPVEDVSKRTPPVPPTVTQVSQGQSIDYARLAAAIVAAQKSQEGPAE